MSYRWSRLLNAERWAPERIAYENSRKWSGRSRPDTRFLAAQIRSRGLAGGKISAASKRRLCHRLLRDRLRHRGEDGPAPSNERAGLPGEGDALRGPAWPQERRISSSAAPCATTSNSRTTDSKLRSFPAASLSTQSFLALHETNFIRMHIAAINLLF